MMDLLHSKLGWGLVAGYIVFIIWSMYNNFGGFFGSGLGYVAAGMPWLFILPESLGDYVAATIGILINIALLYLIGFGLSKLVYNIFGW